MNPQNPKDELKITSAIVIEDKQAVSIEFSDGTVRVFRAEELKARRQNYNRRPRLGRRWA